MALGPNLERIRKSKHVSQSRLGEELGLTQQMISSYEKGLSSPNADVLIRMADYFNVSIDVLVGHVIRPPEDNTSEARFLRYFETLNDMDREKCILIVETLLRDRELYYG